MTSSSISVVDKHGIVFSAQYCDSVGIDATMYRIDGGQLIFKQSDETFRDAKGQIYRFTTVTELSSSEVRSA
jgi:hypothetical protein